MINRVLIRTKVVQLLYSQLLIEKHFMIESQPSAPTKEKRFSYNLYLNLLSLILKLSERIEKRGGERPLANTSFIKKLKADETLSAFNKTDNSSPILYAGTIDSLADKIKDSSLYKDFLRKGDEEEYADKIWESLFNNIIIPDPSLNKSFETLENYSLRGVERMKEMMKTTFVNFYSSRGNDIDSYKTLAYSLGKSRELYIRMLLLLIDITIMREQQLADNKEKYLPTREDINPNTRFVDNLFIKRLQENEELKNYCEKHKISWLAEDRQLIGKLLDAILNSDLYKEYMEFPISSLKDDCELWKNIFKQIILKNEDFLEYLESKSVFWNDDVEIMGTFILKTIKRYEENEKESSILPMYKDKEDAEFGQQLFSLVLNNKDYYRQYINASIIQEKWDTERLAFMDVVIIMTAMAEIMNFPKIPLVVSINEYIEIAKSYSTSKSGSFVNGILASIIKKLKEENLLLK